MRIELTWTQKRVINLLIAANTAFTLNQERRKLLPLAACTRLEHIRLAPAQGKKLAPLEPFEHFYFSKDWHDLSKPLTNAFVVKLLKEDDRWIIYAMLLEDTPIAHYLLTSFWAILAALAKKRNK